MVAAECPIWRGKQTWSKRPPMSGSETHFGHEVRRRALLAAEFLMYDALPEELMSGVVRGRIRLFRQFLFER
jgi:hypothetical protein